VVNSPHSAAASSSEPENDRVRELVRVVQVEYVEYYIYRAVQVGLASGCTMSTRSLDLQSDVRSYETTTKSTLLSQYYSTITALDMSSRGSMDIIEWAKWDFGWAAMTKRAPTPGH
jgi:hypothetical protein